MTLTLGGSEAAATSTPQGKGREMPKYDVDLQVWVAGYGYTTVTVEAKDEDEARELAKEEGISHSDLEDIVTDQITGPIYAAHVQESDAA